MKTIVGLYDNLTDAYKAVDALKSAGFTRDDINLISRDERNEYSRYLDKGDMGTDTAQDVGDGAAAGAGIGAVLGGLGGFLLSIGALAIPGIGPVVAAGPIVATLTGAGIGALAGGIVGALVDLGIPEEEAHIYSEGVKRGGTLVVVHARDDMADRAADVLNRFNPVDIDRRAETWRSDKWTRFEAKDEHGWDADRIERDRAYNRERDNIPVTGEYDRTINRTGESSTMDQDMDRNRDYDRRRVRIYVFKEKR